MRAVAQNKSMTRPNTKTSKCSHCGRASTPVGCREVRDGWYCQQVGLKYDESKLVRPEPDPIGRAEQRVIAELAPLIAKAEADTDEAMVAHAEVESAYLRVIEEAYAKGTPLPPQARGFIGGPVHESATVFDYTTGSYRTLRDKSRDRELIAEEERLRDELGDAETKLARSRGRLSKLERALDHERRVSRNEDRG